MSGRPLRVVQISTAEQGGGAERVALKLHHALRERGHESTLVVGGRASDDPDVLELDGTPRGLRRVAGRAASRAGLEHRGLPGARDLAALLGERPVDVFHAHNLHGHYVDLGVVPRLAARAPTVLTLHDMWLLTGHCAHAFACTRWERGCGACPDLGIYPSIGRDATRLNHARKRRLLRRSGLHVSAPSQWLLDLVARSHLRDLPRRLLPNGVDLDVFAPGDRHGARAELGLPQDRPILFFPANAGIVNEFRDAGLLQRAVERLRDLDPLVLAFGRGGETHPVFRLLPPAESEVDMARYYRAADVVAYPSLADTSPTVVLEALACVRPVVATRVGGILELVADGVDGLLTPLDDEAFAAALRRLLESPELRARFGAAGRERALAAFGFDRTIEAWLAWYTELAA